MKRTAILLAAIATLLIAPLAQAGEGESAVHWTDMSWEQVLATAKQDNKHIVIDFFTTWCGPCKRMDKDTYMDTDVAAFMNANIPVKYDAEKGVGEELAGKYRIIAYPTTLVIAPDGTVIDRHLGYLPPEDFLEVIEGYTRGEGTLAWYQKQVQQDPD
ncbi:MAG: thioredoxin family protein, partial [Gemmatimonadales bacterium]